MRRFLVLICLLCAAGLATAENTPFISEFMAENTGYLLDEDGDSSDWIEIHNPATNTVNLGNWCLTDSAANLTKWRFPATNVGAGQFLLVFASNKDRHLAGRQLHANFKLDGEGEYLALVQPDGLTVAAHFSPQFPQQVVNVSYGLGSQQSSSLPISTNTAGRLLVPTDGVLGTSCTQPGFNDSSWTRATNGIGYELGVGELPPAALRVLSSSPLGYWRLNETSGAAVNLGSLGYAANGTYQGTCTLAQPGVRPAPFKGFESNNLAPRFGPGTGYVTLGQPLANGRFAFTMSGWFNAQTLPGSYAGLWGQNDAIEFGFVDSATLSVWTLSGGSLYAATNLTTNTWYHVAVVGDGASLKLYLNGQFLTQAAANTLDYGSSDYPFNIGGGIWNPTGNQFDGLIDEVAFYDWALSGDDIQLQYAAGQGGLAGVGYLSSLNPEGWWRLNETNGTTAFNAGSLGTALNFPYVGGYTLGANGIRPPDQNGFETNNPAVRLDGASGRVESSAFVADVSTPVFSVSAWAKLAGGSGERVVVSSRDYGTPRGFVMAASSSRWRFYIADQVSGVNAFRILEGPTLTTNTWTHLLGTFDGTTARFYVNGALAASTNLTSFQPNAGNKFRIGYGSYTGSTGYFPGDVDEVAYFKRSLSGNEATNLYARALTGSASTTTTNFYYTPYIRTNIQSALYGVNSGAYWRTPFLIGNPANVASLLLRVRYDDGFAAYLNGVLIEWANAPTDPVWNSAALSERPSAQAVQPQQFDLGSERGWLVPGTNWLAIHALNVSPTNADFLFQCELETGAAGMLLSEPRYFAAPSPGSANGTGTADLGPIITLANSVPGLPLQPAVTDTITVTAKVTPAFAQVSTVTLNWRVMFNVINQSPMLDDGLHGDGTAGDGVYGAVIPAGVAAAGQMIRWFITATDVTDRTSRWPVFATATDSEEYLGTVVANPTIQSSLPVLHTFIQVPSGADARAGTNCSIFYNGEFYDNALISLHGQSSAGWAKKPYNLDFTKEHRFKYLPGKPRQKDAKLLSNWGDKSRTHNPLAHEFIARAGGVSHWCFQVRVQRNGAFWSVADLMEDADDNWLERLGRDGDGALYKIYDNLSGTGSAEKKTRLYEDKSDLNSLITNLNETLPLATRTTYAYDNLDLPQCVSYFVGLAIVSSQDHGHKNYYVYRDSNATGEWAIFPWDTDLSWGRNWLDSSGYFTDTLYVDNVLNFYNPAQQSKGANRLYNLIFNAPEFRNMYLRRLRTAMDTVLQPASVPATNRIPETRIKQMLDLMDPPGIGTSDADLDYSKWGTWGNGYQMRPEAQRIIDTYLPGRRTWLNSASATLNGTVLPASQATNATLSIIGVDYNPASGNQLEEYVCLTNTSSTWVDISGWRLEGAVRFTFKSGTVVPNNSAIYVSPAPKSFRARSTAPRGGMNLYVTGPCSGQLSAFGETLRLLNTSNVELSSLTYPGNPSLVQQFLRVTEIMYNPPPAPAITNDAQLFEYIELRNTSTNLALNLNSVRFTNGISFDFTGSAVTILAPGQRVLLVRNLAAFTARYGGGALVAGEFTGALDSGGETLRLEDAVGEKILEFTYNSTWYPITDGLGFSLVIVDDLAHWSTWGDKAGWRAGGSLNGTPGQAEAALPVFAPVLVNEVLAHTDPPQLDSIELYNSAATNVNLGGWFLTDDFYSPKKYRIPDGTIINAGDYLVFDADRFNTGANAFLLSEYGEFACLFAADASTNLTGYYHGWDFKASPNGVSFGRYVDSQAHTHFVLQSANSLNHSNALPLVGPVVISEIMYHPPELANGVDNDLDEFIELQNITGTDVPLYCTFTNEPGYGVAASTNTWQLRNAVDYDFTTNITLAAGARLLIVGFNPTNTAQLAAFRALYSLPTNVPVFGPWSGQLDNSAEQIELKRPDRPDLTGELFVPYIMVEVINYSHAAPWPANTDGSGNSLQRRALTQFGNDPINWRARWPNDAVAPDTDGDGMADWWEISQGLIVGLNDATLDPDGDGMSNGQEYVAQTKPHDSASLLALSATSLQNGQFTLSFPAVADVSYAVQATDALSSNWQNWTLVAAGPTNRTVTLPINVTNPDARFFRVVTPPVP